MEKFEVHILGCGSALPTTRHFATSQVVNIREKLFMIDCGEGAQMQLRKSKLKFTRLNHIPKSININRITRRDMN